MESRPDDAAEISSDLKQYFTNADNESLDKIVSYDGELTSWLSPGILDYSSHSSFPFCLSELMSRKIYVFNHNIDLIHFIISKISQPGYQTLLSAIYQDHQPWFHDSLGLSELHMDVVLNHQEKLLGAMNNHLVIRDASIIPYWEFPQRNFLYTPLEFAITSCNPELFKLIYQMTPKQVRNRYFIEVARRGWIELLDFMLKHGADIRMKSSGNMEVLAETMYNTRLSDEVLYNTVKWLLENGAAILPWHGYGDDDILLQFSVMDLCIDAKQFGDNQSSPVFTDRWKPGLKLAALLLTHDTQYDDEYFRKVLCNDSPDLLKCLLQSGSQDPFAEFGSVAKNLSIACRVWIKECGKHAKMLCSAAYSQCQPGHEEDFDKDIQVIREGLYSEYFPCYVNHRSFHRIIDKYRHKTTDFPFLHLLILCYDAYPQDSKQRTALLEIFRLMADRRICDIRLEIEDANGNRAIDLIRQKGLVELEEIFLSPAEIRLRDLLIYAHESQIKDLRTVIELAKSDKLLVVDEKQISFPLTCEFCTRVVGDERLKNGFLTNGIKIEILDKPTNEVMIEVTLNDVTVKHLLQNWEELTNFARPPFENRRMLEDTKLVLECMKISVCKTRASHLGVPYAFVSPENLVMVFFGIVRATLSVREAELKKTAIPEKRQMEDVPEREKELPTKKPKINGFFTPQPDGDPEQMQEDLPGKKLG